MKPAERLFIAAMIVLGIVLIGFLLTPAPEPIVNNAPSPLASFITKIITIPETTATSDIFILSDEATISLGGFGGSSRKEAEELEEIIPICTDANHNGICDNDEEIIPPCPDENGNGICDDAEIPPCIDANANGICDEDDVSPCADENANGICDNDEVPPCQDADGDSICDDDEIPDDNNTPLQISPPQFKIAFIGDTGYGNNFRQVLELIRDEGADMVIHAGDLGYDEGNANAPQLWSEQIESILDPTAENGTFAYFFSMGNHDVSHWNDMNGYRSILANRFNDLGITYTGNSTLLGAKTSFAYNGIQFVLTAPGERREAAGDNHAAFIEQQLENNEQLWDICVWHKNQRAMQVGGKGDETGWAVYETCREQGAIIATAHEHSYGRTHVLSDMVNQEIVDDTSPYTIEPGQTFAFHSGLGGQSVRNQRSDINNLNYFASVYTSNQATNRDTAYGALFIEFNVDDEPRKAHAYFKNIAREVIDDFEIYNNTPEPTIEEPVIPPAGFVSAQGTELRLDGESYRFLGFNVYGLANDNTVSTAPPLSICGPYADYGENPDAYLQNLFSYLSGGGINALRFWTFQSYTNGGTDFSSIDRVIHYANQYNVRLIPTLENHWKDCTEGDIAGEEKSSEWYANGYRQPYSNYELSYREYVQRIVTRYKDEPAILMWQLMNEAESEDANALYNFTADVSGLIKSIDQNHLVSLGTLGTGQAGTENENFVRLHALNTIDVVEAHDYRHEEEAWPSGGSNSIDRDWSVAQSLSKPFFIGEAGINIGNGRTFQDRANLFEAKIRAAFERGVAGYLIWKWEDGCTSGNCVAQADPVLDVMERHSS